MLKVTPSVWLFSSSFSSKGERRKENVYGENEKRCVLSFYNTGGGGGSLTFDVVSIRSNLERNVWNSKKTNALEPRHFHLDVKFTDSCNGFFTGLIIRRV